METLEERTADIKRCLRLAETGPWICAKCNTNFPTIRQHTVHYLSVLLHGMTCEEALDNHRGC